MGFDALFGLFFLNLFKSAFARKIGFCCFVKKETEETSEMLFYTSVRIIQCNSLLGICSRRCKLKD